MAAGVMLWDSVLDALGGAVGATCRRHGAKPGDTRALIARGERHVRISDIQNPIEQHISALVRPFTHHEGHDEPPAWDKGHPHPRLPRGLLIEPSKRSLMLLGMHKAPECVQLACNAMEGTPQGKHHQAAGLGRSLQPWTHGIFVDSDDTCRRVDRIAFCSCAYRHLNNGWVGMQIQVRNPISDRHRRVASFAPRLFLALTTAMLDGVSLRERMHYYRQRRFGQ